MATDAELVAAALAGDKAAFGTLSVRHRRPAERVCARFLADPHLAGDVVQEALLVALIQLARLSDPDRFGAWLCGIALNLARQRLRRRATEVPVDPFVPVATADPDSDPAELAERAALRARVRLAVADLPRGQREAVLLFYLRGLSYREVAAELDISVNAVKARLHQARASLHPRLTDKERPMPVDAYTAMQVREVRRSPDARRHVIVLEEQEGDRCLPIWVGPAEATALALDLENVVMARPLTYDLAAGLLAAAGARIREIRITRLHEGTFYAAVVVETGREDREVDARPSDAINLAVNTGAPIRVDAGLLDQADLPDWQDYDIASAAIAAEIQAVLEEERRRLSGEGQL